MRLSSRTRLRQMRTIKAAACAAILLGSFSSVGCRTTVPPENRQPGPLRVDGPYTHRGSGMTFPTAVGNFQRSGVHQFDTEGMDVAAGYNLADSRRPVTATVYVYPAPRVTSIGSPAHVVTLARRMAAQREFDIRKREILDSHTNTRVIQEDDALLPQGGSTYQGRKARFEFEDTFRGRRLPLSSELYLFTFVEDRWTIKYRFTYPKAVDASAEIQAFMRNLPWTVLKTERS